MPAAVLSVVLLFGDRSWGRVCVAILLLDVVLHLLPWRVPRDDRDAFGYWLETLLYVLPMTTVGVVGFASGEPWAVGSSALVWYPVAALLGVSLVLLSGIDLSGLVNGDLAFLAGPSKPSHATARGTSALLSPFGEEAFFRGAAIGLPNVAGPLVLLSAAAFVSRHHLLRGVPRAQRRVAFVEVAAALGLTSIAVASGSIYPALFAHLINNLPVAAINLQQLRLARQTAAQGE